jgi:hypothetical protein
VCVRSRSAARRRKLIWGASVVLLALLLEGCTSFRFPWPRRSTGGGQKIDLIAVLPVQSSAPPSGGTAGDVAPGGEKVVTAAIYGALSGSYEWRFVPDLTVDDGMRNVDKLDGPAEQALALGKAVNADGVLSGSVWRFVERRGTADDAEEGASVGFTLRVFSVASGELLWEESFERTQTQPRWDIVGWLMFWQEQGPPWMSAAALTQEGVNELIDDLRGKLN